MAADPLADLARLEGVPSAVQAARDAVDAVLRDRGLRRIDPELAARGRWAAVRASTELGDDPSGSGDRWLPGVARLYTELTELAGALRRTPPQALARAHSLLGRDLVPEEMLGRTRSDAGVGARMGSLARLLTTPTEAPVPVLAAVVHAELATLRPFGSGDGLLARAVERMVLVDGGVDPPAMIITEVGHLAERERYRRLLAAYPGGRPGDLRAWLLHCADAITRGAELSPAGFDRLR